MMTRYRQLELPKSRRFLTAELKPAAPAPVQRYDSNSIHVWTSSLMAEFNDIIDGELQRLAGAEEGARPAGDAPPSLLIRRRPSQRKVGPLSPWARVQLSLLERTHLAPPEPASCVADAALPLLDQVCKAPF